MHDPILDNPFPACVFRRANAPLVGRPATTRIPRAPVNQVAPLRITLHGKKECFNIALRIMRGNKSNEFPDMGYQLIKDWPWTHPEYFFDIPVVLNNIVKIEIDPSGRLADTNLTNNIWRKE